MSTFELKGVIDLDSSKAVQAVRNVGIELKNVGTTGSTDEMLNKLTTGLAAADSASVVLGYHLRANRDALNNWSVSSSNPLQAIATAASNASSEAARLASQLNATQQSAQNLATVREQLQVRREYGLDSKEPRTIDPNAPRGWGSVSREGVSTGTTNNAPSAVEIAQLAALQQMATGFDAIDKMAEAIKAGFTPATQGNFGAIDQLAAKLQMASGNIFSGSGPAGPDSSAIAEVLKGFVVNTTEALKDWIQQNPAQDDPDALEDDQTDAEFSAMVTGARQKMGRDLASQATSANGILDMTVDKVAAELRAQTVDSPMVEAAFDEAVDIIMSKIKDAVKALTDSLIAGEIPSGTLQNLGGKEIDKLVKDLTESQLGLTKADDDGIPDMANSRFYQPDLSPGVRMQGGTTSLDDYFNFSEVLDQVSKYGEDRVKPFMQTLEKRLQGVYAKILDSGGSIDPDEMQRNLSRALSGGKNGTSLSFNEFFARLESEGKTVPPESSKLVSDFIAPQSVKTPEELKAILDQIREKYLDVNRNADRWKQGQATLADLVQKLSSAQDPRSQFLLTQLQGRTAQFQKQGYRGEELAGKVFDEPTIRMLNEHFKKLDSLIVEQIKIAETAARMKYQMGTPAQRAGQTESQFVSSSLRGQFGSSLFNTGTQFQPLDMAKSVPDFDRLANSTLKATETMESVTKRRRREEEMGPTSTEMSFTQNRRQNMFMRSLLSAGSMAFPGMVDPKIQAFSGVLSSLELTAPSMGEKGMKMASMFGAALPGVIALSAAVGGTTLAFKNMLASVGEAEQKIFQFSLMNRVFGDTKSLLSDIKAIGDGTFTDKSLMGVLSGVGARSYFSEAQTQLTQLLPILQEQAQKLGQPFETFAPQALQAIQSGDTGFLEKSGLMENGGQVLRDYADSMGTSAGSLSTFQVQLAITNELLLKNSDLLSELPGTAEKTTEAIDKLGISFGTAGQNFNDFMAPLYGLSLFVATGALDSISALLTGDFIDTALPMVKNPGGTMEALSLAGRINFTADPAEKARLQKELSDLVKELGMFDRENQVFMEPDPAPPPNGADQPSREVQAITDEWKKLIPLYESLMVAVDVLTDPSRYAEQETVITENTALLASLLEKQAQLEAQMADPTNSNIESADLSAEYDKVMDQIELLPLLIAATREQLAASKSTDAESLAAAQKTLDELLAKFTELENAKITAMGIDVGPVIDPDAPAAIAGAGVALGAVATAAKDAAGAAAGAATSVAGAGTSAATTGGQASVAALQIDTFAAALDRLETSAISAGYAIAGRLVPTMGMAGALQKGGEFQAQNDQLGQALSAAAPALIAKYGEEKAGAIQNMAFNALQAGQNEAVDALTKVGNAGVDSADRVKKAWDDTIEGMISGLKQNSTEGIFGNFDVAAFSDVTEHGKDPEQVAKEVAGLMGTTVGGGREDAIDEPARRMADVVKLGFASPNFEDVKGFIPEEIIAKGEQAVREFAAGMVKAHQDGVSNALYDTDAAVDQVIQKINQKISDTDFIAQVKARLQERRDAGEVLPEMTDEEIMEAMGMDTAPEAMAAAATKMGKSVEDLIAEITLLLDPASGGAENPVVQMISPSPEDAAKLATAGQTAAQQVGTAFEAQVTDSNYGGVVIQKIIDGIAGKKADMEKSGKDSAIWWGGAFVQHIAENTPTDLYNIMVPDLVELLRVALAADAAGNTGGALP